jgi:hypothetical protein
MERYFCNISIDIHYAHYKHRTTCSKSLNSLASNPLHSISKASSLQPQTITLPQFHHLGFLPTKPPRRPYDGDILLPIPTNYNPTPDSCAGQMAPLPCNSPQTLLFSTKLHQRPWLLGSATHPNPHLSVSTTASVAAIHGMKKASLGLILHLLQTPPS